VLLRLAASGRLVLRLGAVGSARWRDRRIRSAAACQGEPGTPSKIAARSMASGLKAPVSGLRGRHRLLSRLLDPFRCRLGRNAELVEPAFGEVGREGARAAGDQQRRRPRAQQSS